MKPADLRGLYEEISNSVTHAIALGLAFACGGMLIARSLDTQNHAVTASAIIYSVCLILLFVSSTLYHGFQLQPYKHYLRVFDHCTIYLMIGGSMTPFIMPFADDTMDLVMLSAVWILSILGVVYKIFLFGRSEWESIGSYFFVTGVGFFGALPMVEHIPHAGTFWLIFGLVVYLSGVYFYVNDRRPFFHTIWHCFVIGGAACHYVAIYIYVLPSAIVD